MNFKVKFEELSQNFAVEFGEVNNISDGGYERGYADGVDAMCKTTVEVYSNDTITTLRPYIFSGFSNLRELNLPALTTISAAMCQNCTALKKIVLPKNNSAVSGSSFHSCRSLEYADLGNARNLSSNAFTNCYALQTLILRWPSVAPLAAIGCFTNTAIRNGTGYIYVPDNLVESYKTATNWTNFASQIRSIEELEEV